MLKEKSIPSDLAKDKAYGENDLILFNDDVNTFDFVIETLMEVCNHDFLQAEQCATIAHYRGKCTVKSGTMETLRPPAEEMGKRGLTVEIE